MSGTRNGEEWPARGGIADLPTGEALHLVASDIAEEVEEEAEEPEGEKPETAVAPEPETSTPVAAEVTQVPAETKRGGRPAKAPATKE